MSRNAVLVSGGLEVYFNRTKLKNEKKNLIYFKGCNALLEAKVSCSVPRLAGTLVVKGLNVACLYNFLKMRFLSIQWSFTLTGKGVELLRYLADLLFHRFNYKVCPNYRP